MNGFILSLLETHDQELPHAKEVHERTTGAGSTAPGFRDTVACRRQKGKMGMTHRLPVGVMHRRDNATDDDEASSLVQVIPGSL